MPALDGIRAVSVVAVMVFHGGVSWARGGFLGVDAFFVLSAYLITSLLLVEWRRTGGIRLVAFWGRRARRLLPALLLVIVAVSIEGRWLLPPEESRLLRGDGLAALFYVANWRMIFRGSDYFTATAAPSPLEHTWSLGIEEQFYLLWPLLVLVVLASRKPLRRLLLVSLVGAVLSTVALAVVYDEAAPGRAYYGSDTRGASLLTGAGLAALLAIVAPRTSTGRQMERKRPRHRAVLGVMALLAAAGTAWSWTHLSGTDARLYHGGMTVGAVAVATVIAHVVVVPDGMSARLLALPPLPALGRISYGLYLWHWPIFIAVNADRTSLHGVRLLTIRCLATLAVAVLSYLLVERPIRSGALMQRRRLASATAAGAVASVAVVVTTATGSSLTGAGVESTVTDGIDHVSIARIPAQVSTGRIPRRDHADRTKLAGTPSHLHHRRAGEPVVVDVFGDSVAWTLVTYLPSDPRLDVRDRTMMGCGVTRTAPYRYFGQEYPTLPPKCQHWSQLWKRAVTADDPDVALILVGRWETMDRVLDGRWTHVGEPDFDAHLRARLRQAIHLAGAHGASVVLATEPYNRRGEQPDGSLYPEDQPQRVTDWNALLRRLGAKDPSVKVIDLGARISPEGRFTWTAGGVQIRADGLHLTPTGVQTWIAPWLLPRLLAAAHR